MRRLLRFIFRNWPLKLGAVGLAALLYGGLILTAAGATYNGSIPIMALHQPASVFLMGKIPDVTSIRYISVGTSAQSVSQASFSATIDLASVQIPPTGQPVTVPVTVTATNADQVQIVDYFPSRVQVYLERLTNKTIPVKVDWGTIPEGVDLVSVSASPETVTVTGPGSVVGQVAAAVARARIQPSAVSVNDLVDLVAVDAVGNVLTDVGLEPSSVRVAIQVASQTSTKAVPVNPLLTGVPAAGYALTGVSVSPVIVTVAGTADVLAALDKLDTSPVNLAGATAGATVAVSPQLPAGVTLVGNAPITVTTQVSAQQGSRDFSIGVTLANAASDEGYGLSTSQVVATIGGPISQLNALDASRLTAVVDVRGLAPGTHVLTPSIDVPAGLAIVGIAPQQVTVTVIPAPSPSPSAPLPPSASPSPSP